MAEFPETGLTPYGTVGIAAGTWEKHNRLLNRSLFYNVLSQEFSGGADPSGTADSGAAIAACWSAAPAYSTIWYPPSTSGQATYKITSALNHPAKPLYHYAPRGGAVIRNTGTGSCVETNGADGWTFDGLTFDTNYPTRTTGRGLVVNAGAHTWRVFNCRFQNIGEMAVTIADATKWKILNTSFDQIRLSGVWMAEGTGSPVADFEIGGCEFDGTNLANAAGHSAIQSNNQNPGGVPTMRVEYGHIHHNRARITSGVGMGLDLITDSLIEANTWTGTPTGESFALTGARNTVRGGRYGGSTVGAAGLLLFCWAGNDQNNADTIISAVQLHRTGAAGTQGVGIAPGENGVTFRDIDIHDVRAKGWGYGVQQYNEGRTGLTVAATVVVHDNHLAGNATAATLFDTAGATLRNNQS